MAADCCRAVMEAGSPWPNRQALSTRARPSLHLALGIADVPANKQMSGNAMSETSDANSPRPRMANTRGPRAEYRTPTISTPRERQRYANTHKGRLSSHPVVGAQIQLMVYSSARNIRGECVTNVARPERGNSMSKHGSPQHYARTHRYSNDNFEAPRSATHKCLVRFWIVESFTLRSTQLNRIGPSWPVSPQRLLRYIAPPIPLTCVRRQRVSKWSA